MSSQSPVAAVVLAPCSARDALGGGEQGAAGAGRAADYDVKADTEVTVSRKIRVCAGAEPALLGRGVLLSHDVLVSRKQLAIAFVDDASASEAPWPAVYRLGVNESFLYRAREGGVGSPAAIPTGRDAAVRLHHGDIISLVGKKHFLRVLVEPPPQRTGSAVADAAAARSAPQRDAGAAGGQPSVAYDAGSSGGRDEAEHRSSPKRRRISDSEPPSTVEPTLALPVLGAAAEFAIPVATAVEIAIASARGYLSSLHPDDAVSIVFVVPSGESSLLEALQARIDSTAIMDTQLSVHKGTCEGACTASGKPCAVLVVSTTWRFKPTRLDPEAVRLHAAYSATTSLSVAARARFGSATPGTAYAIAVPPDGQLGSRSVKFVLLACPPSMRPKSPDCVSSLEDAVRDLVRCYQSIFQEFRKLRGAEQAFSLGNSLCKGGSGAGDAPKSGINPSIARSSRGVVNDATRRHDRGVVRAARARARSKKHFAWRRGFDPTLLYDYLEPMMRAELRSRVVHQDDRCVVVHDKFPKARLHLLLLPRPEYLDVVDPGELRLDHLALLRVLHALGKEVGRSCARDWERAEPGRRPLRLMLGYHSVPSCAPLHLHIISVDLDSPSLTTKKHYNSFATAFFLNAEEVVSRIDIDGKIAIDRAEAETHLKSGLACNRCAETYSRLSLLKAHLSLCDR